jgi:hypothetical protein
MVDPLECPEHLWRLLGADVCAGWMHCGAPDCDKCWHDWPKLGAK